MIHISLIKISFTASLFKKDAHVVPHQTTTATRNTLHMLTAIIKLCTGGTSLSPCSLPSYTCFVPIRTCAQGGYFTLPLLHIPASQQQLQIKQQCIKGWSAVPSSLIFTFPAQRQHSQQDQQWQQQQAIPASNERGTNNNASNVGMPSPVLSFHLR